jgi:glycosyltransferase involved in cell wall biosynthesis
MRLLYLHQYFKTPEEGGAIRSYYIGQALVEAGHEVVMLSSWNGPRLKIEKVGGMQVHYLPVPYSNHMGVLGRSKAFLQYLRLARRQIDALLPADLVYATSTPLTIGLLALYGRWRHKIPYVFEVRDLWPEAPIQLGVLRNKVLIRGLRRLEQTLYQKASAVVALSPGIAEGIRRSHADAPVYLAPNMADCQYFEPLPKAAELVAQWGLEGKFVISYTGAAGLANQLESLIDAARACQGAGLPVHFLVAAEGARLEALKAQAAGLQNVLFLPYGTKEAVKRYLAVSDAFYVSFGPQPVLESCSPNKFFDGLAAGKLCIVNVGGWLRQLVEVQGCGFYAPPQDPQAFVHLLQPYLAQPSLLEGAQAAARRTAEQLFSRRQITAGLVALLEGLVAQR